MSEAGSAELRRPDGKDSMVPVLELFNVLSMLQKFEFMEVGTVSEGGGRPGSRTLYKFQLCPSGATLLEQVERLVRSSARHRGSHLIR